MAGIANELLGTWKVTKSENFDKYLEARGIDLVKRKIVAVAPAAKTIKKNDDSTYTMISDTPKGKFTWTFTLGKPLETKAMDEKMHRITFKVENGGKTLVEDHVRYEESEDVESFTYNKLEDGTMEVKMSCKEAECKRFFKKA